MQKKKNLPTTVDSFGHQPQILKKKRCFHLYDTIIINAPQAQSITISTATAERNVEVSPDSAPTPTAQPLPEEIIKNRLKEQWEPKKKDNVFLSNIYIAADMANSKNKATRLRNCARWLEFAIAEGQPAKLVKTSSCHVRLCPVCQWRRSLATYRTLARIYSSSTTITRHKHLFLTLTQRNIPAAELGAELNRISAAWSRLIRRKALECVKGYTKTVEITRNPKTGEYHPHIHAILSVPQSYGRKEYITRREWQELWSDVMHLDYLPEVHIKAIKKVTGKTVAEVAKYSVKPADYLSKSTDMAIQIVEELDNILDGKRFVSLGGIIAEENKRINNGKNPEELEELIDADGDWIEWERVVYEYNFGSGAYERLIV